MEQITIPNDPPWMGTKIRNPDGQWNTGMIANPDRQTAGWTEGRMDNPTK